MTQFLNSSLLSLYLPHRVHITADDKIYNKNSTEELVGIDKKSEKITSLFRGHLENTYYFDEVKLILRPMSDLNKSIIVKGYNNDEEFIPSEELKKIFNIFESLILTNCTIKLSNKELWYSDIEEFLYYLRAWHFDYMGLLDMNLAFDINMLKDS